MLVKWQFISMKNYLNLTVFVIFCSRQMLNPCNLDTSKVSLWYRYFQTVPRILNTVDLKKKKIEKKCKAKKSSTFHRQLYSNGIQQFWWFLSFFELVDPVPKFSRNRRQKNKNQFFSIHLKWNFHHFYWNCYIHRYYFKKHLWKIIIILIQI